MPRKVKTLLVSLCLLPSLLFGLSGCSPSADRLPLLSGTEVALEQLQGKWVFINYWAVWCKPCVAEIPELNQFAEQATDTAVVLGVNFDGAGGQELRTQVDRLNIDFDVLLADPAGNLGIGRPQVLPATIVVNPRGEVVQVLLGPQTAQGLQRVMNPAQLANQARR